MCHRTNTPHLSRHPRSLPRWVRPGKRRGHALALTSKAPLVLLFHAFRHTALLQNLALRSQRGALHRPALRNLCRLLRRPRSRCPFIAPYCWETQPRCQERGRKHTGSLFALVLIHGLDHRATTRRIKVIRHVHHGLHRQSVFVRNLVIFERFRGCVIWLRGNGAYQRVVESGWVRRDLPC